jgi:nicotinamidase/pyrazinamidase
MPNPKTVFVDVDTQVDFMLPHGHLYVPGAETIIPNLERLIAFAREHGVPVISSMDAHSAQDPEFAQFPPHCVKGTPGQEKIPCTLLPRPKILPNEKQPLPDAEESSGCRQWIVEKQKFDLFTNVNAVSLLKNFGAEQFIVFGVATEYCVKAAVLGLLQMGRPVWLVTDAIRPIDAAGGEAALREMQEAGAKLVTTREAVSAALAA